MHTLRLDPSGVSRSRALGGRAVLLLGAVGLAGVGAVWYADALAFVQGSSHAADAWQQAPIGTAGWVAVVADVAAFGTWLLARHRSRRLASGACHAAVAVLVVASAVAALAVVGRHHPAAEERRIAASFPLPASWGAGSETVVPANALGVPGPATVDRTVQAPVAGRTACQELTAGLDGWARATWSEPTVPAGAGSVDEAVCSMAGTTPQGWSFVANVQQPIASAAGKSTVTVQVAPPLD